MFLSLLKNRRSIRKYQQKKIEKGKIENLVKASLLSPFSRTIYPCEFIFITNIVITVIINRASRN